MKIVLDLTVDIPKNCHMCDAYGISDVVGLKCPRNCNAEYYDYGGRPKNCPLQEVLVGHWIRHNSPTLGICMQDMIECSVCGKAICDRWNPYKNYCPMCGAKMEGIKDAT